jgi:arylsulfatase A-like enzyme
MLVLLGGCAEAPDPRPRRPNVVLVVLDTLRVDYLAFMGGERETMPNLSALAAEGAVFRRAYATSTWTAPSTASILTGTYPDRHGVVRGFLAMMRNEGQGQTADDIQLLRIDAGVETLAEFFQGQGYATYGLATNINVGPEMGFERGFDVFERHEEWPAGKAHARVASWKEELRAGDRPFFLYLHLNDVHKPYERRRKWFQPVGGVPEVSLYQSEMGYLDHWLGQMLQELELAGDDLLCVTSDHGEEFLDHGGMGHHLTLYDEVGHMLLFFRAPALGVLPGVHEREVSGIDVAPTLLELAGFELPLGLYDGTSMAPFLRADAPPEVRREREAELADRTLFMHRWGNGIDLYGAIADGWKMIRGPARSQVFHLDSDPGEETNLIETETEKAAQLSAEIDRHLGRSFERQATTTRVDIDPELLRKLQELGYVEGELPEEPLVPTEDGG